MCLIWACLQCHGNFNPSLHHLTVCFKLASKLKHRKAHNLILCRIFGDLYRRPRDDSGRLPDNLRELACTQLGLESTQEKGRGKRIGMISDLKNELQPSVPCVLLKGKSKQCYFLVSHSVKKTVNYSVGESSPLILIHGNHLVPVSSNFG